MRNKRINQNQTQQQKRKKGCCMQRALACSRSLSLSLFVAWEESANTKKKNAMANEIGSERQSARGGAGEARSLCAKVARGIRHRPLSMQMKRVGKQSHRKREREMNEWVEWKSSGSLRRSQRELSCCAKTAGAICIVIGHLCVRVYVRVCVHTCMHVRSASLSFSFVFGSSSLSSSAR